MVALPLTRKKFTPEEYLMVERAADSRSEYLDGEIYAMADTDWSHGRIVDNLLRLLHQRLKGTPCLGMSRTMKVAAGSAFLYPAFLIACGDRLYFDSERDVLLNPVAIFEIATVATEVYDRTTKLDFYKQVGTLRECIMIAQDGHLVEHYVRTGEGLWRKSMYAGLDAVITLDSARAVIPLAELYEDADLPCH